MNEAYALYDDSTQTMRYKYDWSLSCLLWSESGLNIAGIDTFVSLLSRYRSDTSCLA